MRSAPSLVASLLASCLCASALWAQAESSTLANLTDRAALVVRARVLSAHTEDGMRRVSWRTLENLRGAAPATFVLAEPAGESCGRALHGVATGTGMLLFLTAAAGGPGLVCADARALEPLAPEPLAFVRFWLANPDGAARLTRLGVELGSSHPRLRLDAALTLASFPGLERARDLDRSRIAAALLPALDRNEVEGPSLLCAAVRLQLFECVDPLLERYLDDRRPAQRRLLARALPELPGTTARLAARMPVEPAARRRTVDLLAVLPLAQAQPLLVDLLRAGETGVAVHAGAALAAAGLDLTVLAPQLEPELLAAAHALAAPSAPRFRAIRPGGRLGGSR